MYYDSNLTQVLQGLAALPEKQTKHDVISLNNRTSYPLNLCKYDPELGSDSDRSSQSSTEEASSQELFSPGSPIPEYTDESDQDIQHDECKSESWTIVSPRGDVRSPRRKPLVQRSGSPIQTEHPSPQETGSETLLPARTRETSFQSVQNVPILLGSPIEPTPHSQNTKTKVAFRTKPSDPISSSVDHTGKPTKQPRAQSEATCFVASRVNDFLTNMRNAPNCVTNSTSNSVFEHRRRSRNATANPPTPTLRRDTDNTDTIVRMIVLFCTHLINSIWCTGSGNAYDSTTSQSGSNVLPLHLFITETLRRSKTSYSTLQIALFYLVLLKESLQSTAGNSSGYSGCRAMQCGRRMFLTSLILASKYLQDRNYSAKAWSKISGLPLKEINDNERRFLSIVCWDLHVPKATFENWSKIVLYVCKRSTDPDICSPATQNHNSPGSGSGMNAQRKCALSSMCKDLGALKRWWLVSLQQLKTNIVKCPVRTQKYVESIAPFRDSPYLPQPVSMMQFEQDYAQPFMEQDNKQSSTVSREPSLERMSKRFEPVVDLLHPAPPTTLPQQPTLGKLPTPQTTPQLNTSAWWTPKQGEQVNDTSIHCPPTAAALGNAFKRNCPLANLETCPPPVPRAHDHTHAAPSSRRPTFQSRLSGESNSSSPESVVSDISSFALRSRSSSISSTASWQTVSSQPDSDTVARASAEKFSHGLASMNRACAHPQRYAQQLAHQQPQPDTWPVSAEEQVTGHSPTAVKFQQRPNVVDLNPYGFSDKEADFVDEGYGSTNDKGMKRQLAPVEAEKGCLFFNTAEATRALAERQGDSSAVRSRARPSLARSQTQIYQPRQEQDSQAQHLKRCRSDSCETNQNSFSHQHWPRSATSHHGGNRERDGRTENQKPTTKDIQHPTEQWAEPRMPLQFGIQNKRLALQTPLGFAAAKGERCSSKCEMQSNRLGPNLLR